MHLYGACMTSLCTAAAINSVRSGLGVHPRNSDLVMVEEDLPPMFREDACIRFAKLQCQDSDLLDISRMIELEGNSLASVGACLLIDRKVILETEKDESCPKLKDKVHKILLQWQWNWKDTRTATWARLIKSLQRLGNQELMERIQTHLSQKKYPINGMLVAFSKCVKITNLHDLLAVHMLHYLVISPRAKPH